MSELKKFLQTQNPSASSFPRNPNSFYRNCLLITQSLLGLANAARTIHSMRLYPSGLPNPVLRAIHKRVSGLLSFRKLSCSSLSNFNFCRNLIHVEAVPSSMGRVRQQIIGGKETEKRMTYSHWLLKTEPEEWSWDHQSEAGRISHWDGVRNPQAHKYMSSMQLGDLCFFYHSGKEKAVVGISSVVRTMYPDKSDDTGKYGMVDIKEVCKLVESITLKQIKEAPGISPDFLLLRQPRLSVVPVSNEDWVLICKMGGLSLPPMAPWSEGDAIPLLASFSDSKNAAPHTGKGRGKSAKQNGTGPVVDSEIDHVNETLPPKKQQGKPAKLQGAISPAPVGSDYGVEPHALKKGRGKFGKRHQAGSLDADESDCVDEAPPPKKGRGRSPKVQGVNFSVNALPGPVSGGVVKKMRGKHSKQEWSAVPQDQTVKEVLMEEALGKTTEVGDMAQENVSKIEERDNMEVHCKKEEWKNGSDGKPSSLVGNGSLLVVPQRKRRKGPPSRST